MTNDTPTSRAVHESAEVATDEDLRHAVARTLRRLGVSYDELAQQAASRSFDSAHARLAWMALRDLGEYRPDGGNR